MKKTFEPFERIIFRPKLENNNGIWRAQLVSDYNEREGVITLFGITINFEQYEILPFEGNAHLVGTNGMPEEGIELKCGDVIFCFDKLEDFDKFNLTISKIKGLQQNAILTINEIEYYYCIPFYKFNTNDLKETKKHILCVKNGKLVKVRL